MTSSSASPSSSTSSMSPPPPPHAMSLVPIESAAEWRPIFHDSLNNQVVLYNPSSHALSIRPAVHHQRPPHVQPHPQPLPPPHTRCPYCRRPLPPGFRGYEDDYDYNGYDYNEYDGRTRTSNYFNILAIANRTASEPSSSVPSSRSPSPQPYLSSPPSPSLQTHTPRDENGESTYYSDPTAFPPNSMAEGYFDAFFRVEKKLGMGANGSVFLCQHVLDNNPLGRFAVKKIAVGQSHTYLLQTLREVKLLERLHHPNIVAYHHSWLEPTQFSSFGPRVPTLHVLMQWAEGGSLDDFIERRIRDLRPSRRSLKRAHGGLREGGEKEGEAEAEADGDGDGEREIQGETEAEKKKRAFRARVEKQKQKQRERKGERHDGGASPSQAASASMSTSTSTQQRKRQRQPKSKPQPRSSTSSSRQKRKPKPQTSQPLNPPRFSPLELHSLFSDIVSGLDFLHSRNILHLDMKPGNVLLRWEEGGLPLDPPDVNIYGGAYSGEYENGYDGYEGQGDDRDDGDQDGGRGRLCGGLCGRGRLGVRVRVWCTCTHKQSDAFGFRNIYPHDPRR
ncbi:hypothetical protein D9758_012656 [Tetrapyrgos nigripes]|uniref:non-specific serine/threonine protein kinase n=1 Tax=Tetrapyrgos nigripes TaxID=182062 RepID=A0A8H5LMH4_9AGAR|nr:hypothetical protein D9758_012656 [Tetrapyrgos nigripes]